MADRRGFFGFLWKKNLPAPRLRCSIRYQNTCSPSTDYMALNLLGRKKDPVDDAESEAVHLAFFELDAVPASVFKTKQLVTLSLSSNRLDALPPDFHKLSKLETLSLGGNRFTTAAIDDARLDKLDRLSKLNLCRNALTAFPETLCGISKLTSLSLAENEIVELPDKIAKLTKLRYLGLTNNKLKTLNQNVGKLRELEVISAVTPQAEVDVVSSSTRLVSTELAPSRKPSSDALFTLPDLSFDRDRFSLHSSNSSLTESLHIVTDHQPPQAEREGSSASPTGSDPLNWSNTGSSLHLATPTAGLNGGGAAPPSVTVSISSVDTNGMGAPVAGPLSPGEADGEAGLGDVHAGGRGGRHTKRTLSIPRVPSPLKDSGEFEGVSSEDAARLSSIDDGAATTGEAGEGGL
ncbi:hypothetical protein BDK51DRAFT_38364 [Blyttiomyces helicus]|uniref:L domain-like protein n=1 Tax=Blyttiomyces helicus TaxID=388810 RepID=A0A4P9W4Y0_9FUNG|nr:hypothetical protein BDK51DRAFT_38364 [Blyttiomyces helicus]|eukprot:RKO87431.1 hypothetical protein BDK51DRAFT_38364 [Blyttiomyces helicus]